jgi:dihydrofolate reductase
MIAKMLPLQIITCMARNGIIGCAGKIPWHEPEDLQHFRRLTTGHSVVMGRLTYESIGRPLPNRRNIVVTKQPHRIVGVGIETSGSVGDAIELARRTDKEPFVIGGARVYWAALPWTTRIYRTVIDRQTEGDVCFPLLDEFDFELTEERVSGHLAFQTWDRRMFTTP